MLLMALLETKLGDVMLVKVAVFVIVQALVYVILRSSSNLFANTKSNIITTSLSFKTSINMILAAISDLPLCVSDQPSPSPRTTEAEDDQYFFPLNN